MPVWHHAVSQCRGIQDVETGKKHCVDPTARYASKFQFDHLTITVFWSFEIVSRRHNFLEYFVADVIPVTIISWEILSQLGNCVAQVQFSTCVPSSHGGERIRQDCVLPSNKVAAPWLDKEPERFSQEKMQALCS